MVEPTRQTALHRLIPVIVMVAVMWGVEIVDSIPGVDLDRFGIRPRDADGLIGIVASPFLHGDFSHLVANTGAFLVLGGLIALTTRRYWVATIGIAVVGGFGTWLIAQPFSIHIGASGLVYGYAAFLVTWGILVRKIVDIVVSVAVVLVYGGLAMGVLPGQPGISWQGHLCGAVAGVVVAWWAAGRAKRQRALTSQGQGPSGLPA